MFPPTFTHPPAQITGIGYGDIAPRTPLETFYQMVNIVVDMFMIASLHGFCAMFLEEHDAKSNDMFNNKMQTLQNYISFRNLAKTDGDAILAQYTHMWRKVKSTKAEKNEILSLLSQSTAMDLSLHLQSGILKMVPLLNDLAVHARRRIALVLHPQVNYQLYALCFPFLSALLYITPFLVLFCTDRHGGHVSVPRR